MIYDVPRANIIRPHGEGGRKAYELPEFGHNDDLMISEYKDRLLETFNDLEKEYYRWAIEYLEQTRKDVSFHIGDVKQFMNWNIVDLIEIVVIGMSLGKVDLLYFKDINNLFPNTKWIITYYCDGEDEHIRDILNTLGVASNFIEFINLKLI